MKIRKNISTALDKIKSSIESLEKYTDGDNIEDLLFELSSHLNSAKEELKLVDDQIVDIESMANDIEEYANKIGKITY